MGQGRHVLKWGCVAARRQTVQPGCRCDLKLGYPELGWVSLAEIGALSGRLGLPVERDLHFVPQKRLSVYAREARLAGRIVG
ncbi:MAG: DUF2958 domain-containing protein [Comamonas sp.]|nr:DUF2958 domain-containing protein [Comamonas sp.]